MGNGTLLKQVANQRNLTTDLTSSECEGDYAPAQRNPRVRACYRQEVKLLGGGIRVLVECIMRLVLDLT